MQGSWDRQKNWDDGFKMSTTKFESSFANRQKMLKFCLSSDHFHTHILLFFLNTALYKLHGHLNFLPRFCFNLCNVAQMYILYEYLCLFTTIQNACAVFYVLNLFAVDTIWFLHIHFFIYHQHTSSFLKISCRVKAQRKAKQIYSPV